MDTPINTGFGSTNATETNRSASSSTNQGVCEHCGQPLNRGLEQFLGRLGVSDDSIKQLKSALQNVDVDEYLNNARDYIKSGGDKAQRYAKDNPGKVAAGVAVLAVGAGLLLSALNKD